MSVAVLNTRREVVMHRLPSLLFALAASAAVGGMAANAPAGVRLARYAGDKAAAASFTFDDGYKSHTAVARVLDACGVKATFFVVTRWVPAVPEEGDKARLSWPELRALAESGHEIGSHSLTHMNLQSVTNETTLAAEIDSAADRIAQGTGREPLSYAYPFCKSNPTVRARVLRRHVAARGYYPLFEGNCPAEKARPWIEKALADGGWHVYLSHGIATNALKAHLDDIAPLRDRLWLAPYGEVAAYVAARDAARLRVRALESGRCLFTLALPEDASPLLARSALTVVIPAAGVGASANVACIPAGRVAGVETAADAIRVTLRPGPEEVVVTWAGGDRP